MQSVLNDTWSGSYLLKDCLFLQERGGKPRLTILFFIFKSFKCQIKAILLPLLKAIAAAYRALTMSQALCEVLCVPSLHVICTASL